MAFTCLAHQIVGMKSSYVLALLVPALLAGMPAHAQNAPDGSWHYLVQPYVLLPNMRGETGIRNLPLVEIDQDPSDIFDKLQMGAMFYAEARNDQWTFSTDLLYMNLGADMSTNDPGLINSVDVDVSQVGWELAAMRRLTPQFELGLGLTYNQVDVDVEIEVALPGPPSQVSAGLEENWIDPTIVARGTWPINDQWFFQARGNVGGFGVGSDLMWQLMADVGYRPSEKWFLSFGYRIIDIDYDQGSGADRFVYDVQTFGPQFKIGFNF
jgi:hypothetical protein